MCKYKLNIKQWISPVLTVLLTLLYFTPYIYINAQKTNKVSEENTIEYTVTASNCTKSTADGTLKIKITNANAESKYSVSINGGEKFHKINGTAVKFVHLKPGLYSICISENEDTSVKSAITSVFVYKDNFISDINIAVKHENEKIFSDGSLTVSVLNYSEDNSYETSLNGGKTWTSMLDDTIEFTGKSSGSYGIIVRNKNDIQQTSNIMHISIKPPVPAGKKYIEAPMILQYPELPTGCEITSLTMLLQFLGFNADKEELAANYLPKGEYRASDYFEVFVGDPRSTYAYGCYPKAIITAAEKYLSNYDEDNAYTTIDLSGCLPENLYSCIDNGYPVVTWASMNMKPIKKGAVWTIPETGKTVVWTAGEHCLLLTGYDIKANKVYFNDPMEGLKAYDMDIFEERFEEVFRSAVIIIPSIK